MEQQKRMRERAQHLRRNMTKEENKLWYQYLKTYPIQFKRQYQIGNYFVDFYCYQAKLVIELDGSQHYEQKAMDYDKVRTDYLESQNLLVIRFSNLDIKENFQGVCAYIDRIVQNRMKKL